MQLKSGLTLPNGQKHQEMCACKSNHLFIIHGKTMIFKVLSICISRMRQTKTCIHKLYVETKFKNMLCVCVSEAALNTCKTKMYNFIILILGGGMGGGWGINRYLVLIRCWCSEKKSSNFMEEWAQVSYNLDY